MRRKTPDALAVGAGLVTTALLLVAGGLLAWGHSFVTNEVHTRLAPGCRRCSAARPCAACC